MLTLTWFTASTMGPPGATRRTSSFRPARAPVERRCSVGAGAGGGELASSDTALKLHVI